MEEIGSMHPRPQREDELYLETIALFGAALERLARGYEADAELRRDLLQEIHLALWRSFRRFDGRCSVRTWMYRVAHNTAASYVIRRSRMKPEALVSLDQLDNDAVPSEEPAWDRGLNLERLLGVIQILKPIDRQVILSYLEDMDAASIGEITGLSAANVAMKIHRIKEMLARQFERRRENERTSRE